MYSRPSLWKVEMRKLVRGVGPQHSFSDHTNPENDGAACICVWICLHTASISVCKSVFQGVLCVQMLCPWLQVRVMKVSPCCSSVLSVWVSVWCWWVLVILSVLAATLTVMVFQQERRKQSRIINHPRLDSPLRGEGKKGRSWEERGDQKTGMEVERRKWGEIREKCRERWRDEFKVRG